MNVFQVDSLLRQNQATHTPSTLLSRCSVRPMFLQLATVPFLLRPLFFLICSNEMNSLCHWCASKIDLRRTREDSSFWESPFANSQSPHMSPSLVVDQDSLLINSNSGATTSGGYYRRTSGQSASKQQRSVGFHNVEDYRPTAQHRAGGGSFFPDIFMVSKRTNTGGGGGQPHHPRKKNGRYWKRYSCSSCSEPMSLFTSSSTTSINHVHNLGVNILFLFNLIHHFFKSLHKRATVLMNNFHHTFQSLVLLYFLFLIQCLVIVSLYTNGILQMIDFFERFVV